MANNTQILMLGILGIFLVLASLTFIASAANVFGEEEAKKTALKLVSGEIQEIDVEYLDGRKVYEIDIKSGDWEKEVVINQNGQVVSVQDEEIDIPITGTPLELASKAALDYIGEGRVTDTEIGDEEGYYEIEITLNNNREVDVHLDENFNVLSTEYD